MPMIRYPRPESDEYPAYYAHYLDALQEPPADVLELLRRQGLVVLSALKSMTDEQANHRYAPGKWTVKEVIGHLVDTERLFGFRALWIARGAREAQPSMDENEWAARSNAGDRPRADLWREHHVARTNHLYLFRSFDAAARARTGAANGALMSVNSIPWLMAAHEAHHLAVLRDLYGVAVDGGGTPYAKQG